MNLIAAAVSRKPITTFTEFSQPPDFGSDFIRAGKRARRKNGEEKTVAKTAVPIIGQSHSPVLTAEKIRPPTNGTVQVNEVREKTSPISITPTTESPSPAAFLLSLFRIDVGTWI